LTVVSEDDLDRKFRCLGCGALADFGEVPHGVLTFLASRGRPGPPCAQCAGFDYVRCGTMTEYYRWTRRDDVCRVGGHVHPRVQRYTLVPRGLPQPHPTSGLVLASLTVAACPDHVGVLRERGVNGFFLED
jgi:hypothetical protein